MKKAFSLNIIIFPLLILVAGACDHKSGAPHPGAATAPQSSGKTGEQLAVIYCAGCHLFPEPALLDKTTWGAELLPNMGCRLGIRTSGYDPYQKLSGVDRLLVESLGIYPEHPVIAPEDWQKIVAFYREKAPEKLPEPSTKPSVSTALKLFNVKKPALFNAQANATLTQFNAPAGEIYFGTLNGQLLVLDAALRLRDSFQLYIPPVCIVPRSADTLDVLSIGRIRPTEQEKGLFGLLDTKAPLHSAFDRIEGLQRPVWIEEADLVKGGEPEVLMCEFGYESGRFSWYEHRDGRWQKHILAQTAGAIKTAVHDFDRDGLSDFAVLIAQGNERLSIWYNRGKGVFEEKTVLRFPPVYGSCDFQLADFNSDGDMDLLYVNGDNADFSPVLKPYHGIRLFFNDGKDNFSETWFYPMHGAFHARAADFDLDGDWDIAAASFFPGDPARAGDCFVYLEQTQTLNFQAYTFKGATAGRWLTMDTGDIDRDGDPDIILGSYLDRESQGSPQWKHVDRRIPFLLLENKIK